MQNQDTNSKQKAIINRKQLPQNQRQNNVNNQLQLKIQHENEQSLSKIYLDQKTKDDMHNLFKNKTFQDTQINLYNSNMNYLHLMYILRQSINTNTNSINKFININIVKKLTLAGNNIGDDGIKQLCRKVYKWLELEQLRLHWSKITIKGIQYLSQGAQMKLFPELSLLYLGGNHIGGNHIGNNQYNSNLFESFQSISEGLLIKFTNNNTKLKDLILYQNQINDNDMLKLFKCKDNYEQINNNLGVFNYLQKLDLSWNKIAQNGAKVFYNGFSQIFPSLKILNLHGNKINKDGIKHLINFMNQSTQNNYQDQKKQLKLEVLVLSQNSLCSQAIKIFVSNKNKFNNLKKFQLSDNSFIGDQGISYFMKACQEGAFQLLQQFWIRNINLSQKGIQFIIKNFHTQKTLPSIKRINLKNNKRLNDRSITKNILQKRFKSSVKIVFFDQI